jgi:hypothetical protein
MRHESQHTIAQQLGDRFIKYGLPRPQPAAKNRIEGWALIGQLFDMDDLVVTTDCPLLISTIPMLVRDSPDNPEDVKKLDGMEDDIADAFRYGVKSYLNPGKMPQALVDANLLENIKNPVARQIKAFEMYCKKEKQAGPVQDRRLLPWQIQAR